jgi:hypothetical protein
MPGGELYTREELLLIAASVARFDRPERTYERYLAAFGPRRSKKAVLAKRSLPEVQKLVHQIVDAGLAALAPVDNAEPLTAEGPSQKLKAHWDPEAGELTILKPRDGTWSKPSDLLDRARIAWEEGENGEPVPIHWTIQGIDLNEWATAMKLPDGTPASVPNWQAKLRLKARPDAPVLQAMERILLQIGQAVPARPKVAYMPQEEGHLLELVLPDLHFGKLAHAAESGEDADTKIITARMLECAESLISRAQEQYPISEFVYIVGNDLLNADSEEGTTTGGTRQDVDSRKHKVLDAVMVAMTHVIDRLLEIAPGSVYCVPGNHDRESSQAVARFLAAWYRQTQQVKVDTSPMTRKYHRFGNVLLGFTHGDSEPVKHLPIIMADESPDFGKTTIREWHIGHVHKAQEFTTMTMDETRGIRVRHLPSLSGLDAWHARKGYRSLKQADAFVWSATKGLRSIIVDQPTR